MDEILKLATIIIQQKISDKIKAALHVIFVAGISSVIFSKYYFRYELIDAFDYKAIYFFFVNGTFIIPFAIFFLIWQVTTIFGILLFKLPNLVLSKILKDKIKKFVNEEIELVGPKSRKAIGNFTELPESTTMESTYDNVIPDTIKSFRRIDQVLDSIQNEFNLFLRALIAIILYYCHIPYFNTLLLVILVLTIIVTWIMQAVAYQIVVLLPYGFTYITSRKAKKQ